MNFSRTVARCSAVITLILTAGLLAIPAQAKNRDARVARVAEDPLMVLMAQSNYHYFFEPPFAKISALPTRCAGCSTQLPEELAENPRCEAFYAPIEQKGTLRIHVSFGYFDDSEGKPYLFAGKDLGMNAALDRPFYLAFAEGLKARCRGQAQLCGFLEVAEGQFTKTIKAPDGRTVQVELGTDSASLTYNHETNTVTRANDQDARTAESLAAFHEALATDDVVAYIGHSRNGGGPDFSPPHLLANFKPNYRGYYETERLGYHDLLDTIAQHGSAPPLLGMFSCLSEGWFGAGLDHVSPATGYVLTPPDLLVGMNEVFAAAIATFDSVLRFQCYEGMAAEVQSVRVNPNYNVHVRNFLSDQYPVDTHAKITAPPADLD